MLKFEDIVEIRRLYYHERLTITDIAERTHKNYKTVQKYIDQSDFSIIPRTIPNKEICPKLDPWKDTIDEWLTADFKALRKQRHTAQRVYERLKEEFEDFNCSCRTVTTYVSKRKEELKLREDEPMLPLIHKPGECQGDFGTASFIENGVEISGKYFVLDFPYSNCAFAQLKYGENLECLLESLDAIFRYIGGVPPQIWFDNASTMVTKVIRGGARQINERFLRFAEHYRFVPVFMNPYSGNEKGGAESKVGYIRRHMLVPVPEFTELDAFNLHFFQLQEDDMHRFHYRKNKLMTDLFMDDMRQLLPLPASYFELADYRTYRTDVTAMFTVDGKYTYSTHPDLRKKSIIVKFTSSTVTIIDERLKENIVHRRLYGEESQTSIIWAHYLRAVSMKPRAFFNTGIADFLPEEIRIFLFRCDNHDGGRVLKILADLNDAEGFAAVKDLVNKAAEMKALDPDNFEALYRRLCLKTPVFSAPQLPEDFSDTPSFESNLSLYDSLLKGRND